MGIIAHMTQVDFIVRMIRAAARHSAKFDGWGISVWSFGKKKSAANPRHGLQQKFRLRPNFVRR
jgi:hypothetical protein